MNKYLLFAGINVLISSFSQILLKSSANEENSFIKSYLNWKVILSYMIFFVIMFINSLFIFKHIKLNQISIIESLGYVFVPILSVIFFKEKLNKYKIVGILLIIIGVAIFNL